MTARVWCEINCKWYGGINIVYPHVDKPAHVKVCTEHDRRSGVHNSGVCKQAVEACLQCPCGSYQFCNYMPNCPFCMACGRQQALVGVEDGKETLSCPRDDRNRYADMPDWFVARLDEMKR